MLWKPLVLVFTLLLSPLCAGEADGKPGGGRRFGGSGPGPRLPEGTRSFRDLAYADVHPRNKLDLFVPKSDKPLPLLVWIHGGAFMAGSKEGAGECLPFLNQRYAVASINYRLSQHAVFPALVHDCKGALRWLRAHAKEYNLDAGHIGVWGSSAGGYLVAMLGVTAGVKELEGDVGGNLECSSRVQAVCDYFGPTDFLQMDSQAPPNSAIKHDAPGSPESKLLGGPIQDNKEKAAKANPITYVTKDAAPFLIVHGDADNLVPYGQSKLLQEALQKAGADSTFLTVPGKGHGGFPPNQYHPKVLAFFNKHLKAGQ